MTPEQFIYRYPHLYHATRAGAWSSISDRGLLSASAALDHFGILGALRIPFESRYRPEDMHIFPEHASDIVLREQTRMPRHHLMPALKGTGMSPEDWYRLVNSRVFFWPTEDRLRRALSALNRRTLEHDVLIVDTASFVAAHGGRMELLSLISSHTFPIPQVRSRSTFKPMAEYPTSPRGRPLQEVVEVAVEDSVPDIVRFVLEVRRMRGNKVIPGLVA